MLYVEAGLRAMWEDGLKMDDPAILNAAFAGAGLPAEELVKLSQAPEVKEELATATAEAVARGAFGVPTLFVGAHLFFDKERLGDVEAAAQP